MLARFEVYRSLTIGRPIRNSGGTPGGHNLTTSLEEDVQMAGENYGYGFGGNFGVFGNNQGALFGGNLFDTMGNKAGGQAIIGQQGVNMQGAAVTPLGPMQGQLAFQNDQLVLGAQSPFGMFQAAVPLPQLPPPPPPAGFIPPAPGAPAAPFQPMPVPPQLGFLAGMLPGLFRVG
jgi:hypothetical protein